MIRRDALQAILFALSTVAAVIAIGLSSFASMAGGSWLVVLLLSAASLACLHLGNEVRRADGDANALHQAVVRWSRTAIWKRATYFSAALLIFGGLAVFGLGVIFEADGSRPLRTAGLMAVVVGIGTGLMARVAAQSSNA